MIFESGNVESFETFEMHRAAKVGISNFKRTAPNSKLDRLVTLAAPRGSRVGIRVVTAHVGEQLVKIEHMLAEQTVWGVHVNSRKAA
jgi:hypothetical protein